MFPKSVGADCTQLVEQLMMGLFQERRFCTGAFVMQGTESVLPAAAREEIYDKYGHSGYRWASVGAHH